MRSLSILLLSSLLFGSWATPGAADTALKGEAGSFRISSLGLPSDAFPVSCPNDSGQIAFWDKSSKGIFLLSKGTISKVASEDEIKVKGWEKVSQVGPLSLNASGKVAFVAFSGKGHNAVFLADSKTLRKVAVASFTEPARDKFGGFHYQVLVNSKDQVLFSALVSKRGPPRKIKSGLFLASGDAVVQLVGHGDPSPLGGIFLKFFGATTPMMLPFSFSLNNRGEVAFAGMVDRDASSPVIFVASQGVIRKIAAAGDPLPLEKKSKGFVFPALNDLGHVVFMSIPPAIILAEGRTLTKVVALGDPTPIGGRFEDIAMHPALNNKGQVAFGAKTSEGTRGIFLASGGMIQKIAASGDATSSGGSITFKPRGGALGSTPDFYCLSDSGQVTFRADQGFFVASPIR